MADVAEPRVTKAALLSEAALKAFAIAEYKLRHHARYDDWSDDQRIAFCLKKAFEAAKEWPVLEDPTESVAIKRAIDQTRIIEEALVRRMLCDWDPAWGEPQIALGWPWGSNGFQHTKILGLCRPTKIGETADILVNALDHLDGNGNVLPPIPDKGQLAIFEERLRTKGKKMTEVISPTYNYLLYRPMLFTEDGSVRFLKIRDRTRELLNWAGACRVIEMTSGFDWDPLFKLACVDRMVELGELHELTPPGSEWRFRVFVEKPS